MMASCFSILPHYFNKKLGLANGILNTGGCVLTLLDTIVVAFILENYGLRVFSYSVAGFSLFLASLSLVFKPQLPVDTSQTFGQRLRESFGLEIFKKPKFLIWVSSSVFGFYGNCVPVMTMVIINASER